VLPTLVSLTAWLALAAPAGSPPPLGTAPALNVPYLPQTEALCGGAAVAMVFRYWGDRHADVQQFAPLVDPRAGGIAGDVLTEAVRQRNWQILRLSGSIDVLRDRLTAGQPLILLIEDRPGRYHYVVAVGVRQDEVYVHDPMWGPLRRYSVPELIRVWQPTNFWTLMVLPGQQQFSPGNHEVGHREAAASGPKTALHPGTGERPPGEQRVGAQGTDPQGAGEQAMDEQATGEENRCDRLLEEALDEIATRGLATADEALGRVRTRCPHDARPVAELAGVRFAERRWPEAAALAEKALSRDPSAPYAWDVLGSSRFMQDDLHGALRAWNRIGKPRLDSVRIDGLSRTRYALVAQALALVPNTVLTEAEYRRAERRLEQLPTRLVSRIGYRPEVDGFATVDIAVVERPRTPSGAAGWTATGARALVNREFSAALPGWNGQGEVWSARWRWWAERPRLTVAFAAPRVGRLPGVWRVDASWETETYDFSKDSLAQAPVRERRAHGGITVTDWIGANTRYEISAGADAWNGSRRTMSIGSALEQRLFDDRIGVAGSAHTWVPFGSNDRFSSAAVRASFRSSPDARGVVHIARAGAEATSSRAPFALWPGAGEGHARAPLLRGHPLLEDGVIRGQMFGRRIVFANVEAQRWFDSPSLFHLGLAAFADMARTFGRLANAEGESGHVDAGLGVRVRLPGGEGTLRFDYGRGLRDGASAFTVGWQY
jgi:hypothetical protein